jgi:RHS repeat-associated protein
MTPLHTDVLAGGDLMATYDFPDGGVHFALTDPLGTRRMQVSGAGVAEIGFVSIPYGNNVGNTDLPQIINYAGGNDATEQHFTNKERDNETGNDYFEARYYSSAIGRFLIPDWSAQQEPVPYARMDNPQSLNLYSYVVNNPLGGVDLAGHATDASVGDMGPGYTAFAETVENMVGVEGLKKWGSPTATRLLPRTVTS